MGDDYITIAIIDDSVGMCETVARILESSGNYKVVGTAHDGERGLRMLLESEIRIDVALIDVVLPLKDGLYVLEELGRYTGRKPVCIMFSGIGLDSITRKAIELGAAYFILKPFDVELLCKRIKVVWQDRINAFNDSENTYTAKMTPEGFVTDCLRNVLIPPTLRGYNYLKSAIMMVIENHDLLVGVTKVLYPALAKEFHVSSASVERSMRHAIETAWRSGYAETYYKMTGKAELGDIKPTIKSFITDMAELYHAESKKK